MGIYITNRLRTFSDFYKKKIIFISLPIDINRSLSLAKRLAFRRAMGTFIGTLRKEKKGGVNMTVSI